MKNIRAVVFDLDDTLYPERAFVMSGFAAVANRFADLLGPPERSQAIMRELFDGPRRNRVFDDLLARLGLPRAPGLLPSMVDCYRTHRPAISPYPDASECLARVQGAFRLGLITDGYEQLQRNKINALGLNSVFDAMILTAELGTGMEKPHPRAFELMAGHLATPHEHCAYVADNAAKDFLAPNALGWLTVRIQRPNGIYRDAEPPPGGAPRRHINLLTELNELLRE